MSAPACYSPNYIPLSFAVKSSTSIAFYWFQSIGEYVPCTDERGDALFVDFGEASSQLSHSWLSVPAAGIQISLELSGQTKRPISERMLVMVLVIDHLSYVAGAANSPRHELIKRQ